jgi:hypothetical protein
MCVVWEEGSICSEDMNGILVSDWSSSLYRPLLSQIYDRAFKQMQTYNRASKQQLHLVSPRLPPAIFPAKMYHETRNKVWLERGWWKCFVRGKSDVQVRRCWSIEFRAARNPILSELSFRPPLSSSSTPSTFFSSSQLLCPCNRLFNPHNNDSPTHSRPLPPSHQDSSSST